MKKQFVTYIGTKNDTYGNPRRAYIVNEIDFSETNPYPYIVDVLDEGYQGREVLRKNGYNLNPGGYMIETTPSEYKNFLKIGKAKREGRNK